MPTTDRVVRATSRGGGGALSGIIACTSRVLPSVSIAGRACGASTSARQVVSFAAPALARDLDLDEPVLTQESLAQTLERIGGDVVQDLEQRVLPVVLLRLRVAAVIPSAPTCRAPSASSPFRMS